LAVSIGGFIAPFDRDFAYMALLAVDALDRCCDNPKRLRLRCLLTLARVAIGTIVDTKQINGNAMTTPLHYMSAHQLAANIQAKEISAVELLKYFIDRVEKYNPKLNAIIWMDSERALKRAKEADAALARGEIWGPLHGVPLSIKESYQVAGSPTTRGMPEYKDHITETTSISAQRLIDAGVIFFAKTNVPIHLADWQSFNEIYGTTNNPWDVTLSPGGSSGGSAAALASGLTGIEAGSDIGASIRNPAHYCGVFGHKPTYGVVPWRGQSMPGVYAGSDISVVGPMARSAVDLEIALDVMAGPDVLDEAGWRLELPNTHQKSLKDFRVAVKLSDPNSEVDQAYADQLQSFVGKLSAAGAVVNDNAHPDIDTERLHEVYVLLLRAATSSRLSDDEAAHWVTIAAEAGSDAASYLVRMARANTLSHRDWLRLNNERHAMRFKFAEFFQDWDILLCPAAASAAFPHDQFGERHDRTIPVNGHGVPTTDQLFWAGFSGVVYLPSTVGPAGLQGNGLPVGYQAIAGQLRDKTAIRFAQCVEREIGGFVPPPGYD
jgi:amidase